MQRTIHSELLKRLRNDRGWSQEELAVASNLSTRTVQRLEAHGKGAIESIKSVAAALEVQMHNLEEQPRTQQLGVRLGLAGVAAGSTCASAAILANWLLADGSAYETGLNFGIVGAITGLSCALIGWASGRG